MSDGVRLAADRTVRYQTASEDKKTEDLTQGEWIVSLGTDVAVSVKVGEDENAGAYIARVFRMSKANHGTTVNPSGWTDYRRQITLPGARKENIWLHVYYYKRDNNNHSRFELNNNDPTVIHTAALHAPMRLTLDETNGMYEADENSLAMSWRRGDKR
jgi:hypothetical protein